MFLLFTLVYVVAGMDKIVTSNGVEASGSVKPQITYGLVQWGWWSEFFWQYNWLGGMFLFQTFHGYMFTVIIF